MRMLTLRERNENAATMAKKMKKPLRSPSERPCARNPLGTNTTTNHMDGGGQSCGYVDVLIFCVRLVWLAFQLVFKVEHLRFTTYQHKMCLRYSELEFSPETRYRHRRWCCREDVWSAGPLDVSSMISDSRCYHMMIREKKQKIGILNHSTDFLYQGLREALVELWTAISRVILGVRG